MSRTGSRFPHSKAALAIVCLLATSAGCGDDGEADEAVPIEVSGAWARTSAAGQTVGAIYFEIEAAGGDTLRAITVPADVAAAVELHESVVHASDASDAGEHTSVGEMSMGELAGGLALPAGMRVALEPGGAHAMLVDLAGPLVAGATFPMTLEFEHAAALTVEVPVADIAP